MVNLLMVGCAQIRHLLHLITILNLTRTELDRTLTLSLTTARMQEKPKETKPVHVNQIFLKFKITFSS
jgi:hypothetical protein